MKSIKFIMLFISILVAFSTAQANDKLKCKYVNGYFRVTNGLQNWEKYVPSTSSDKVLFECGEFAAAAIIDSYFVVFSDGAFKEKFVGSSSPKNWALAVNENMAAAAFGSYFLVARNGLEIQEKFVGTVQQKPIVAASKDVAVSIFGSYFLGSDGIQIQEKYVGITNYPKVAAANSLGAALAGNYFLGFSNGNFIEKFVSNRSTDDLIVHGSFLFATYVGSYFIVFDSRRGKIMESYVGEAGEISVINDVPIFETTSGTIKRYNSVNGQFE